MKVNQIIGEHKKGVRAMKYNKKPVNPSAAHAKAKEKLQAITPMEGVMSGIHMELSDIVANEDFDALYNLFSANTPAGRYVQELAQDVSIDHRLHPDDDFEKIEEIVFNRLENEFGDSATEGIEVKPMPGASQVIGADGKPIATTDAATAAVIKTAADKGQFTADGSTDTPMPEAHGDIGGDRDPTDKFIYDITDHDFEKQADEGMFGFGNKTAEEWAKTSPQMAQLLQFRTKAKGTQYEAQVEKRIQILKDRLDMDAGEVAGPGGTPKPVVPPEQFNMNQLREADNALLEKMRTIAGLR